MSKAKAIRHGGSRYVAVLAALVVGVAGLTSVPTAQARPTSTAAGFRGYQPPPISWGACDNPTLQQVGAQCGSLIVPLDYGHPHGKQISLAVSRVLHTSSAADYQGVVLANPGGPGVSGLFLSFLGQLVPNGVGGYYDWIGFDPRGVGASKPSLSCDPGYFGYNRPNYVPRTRALVRIWLHRARHYADACRRSAAAELLGHVKTVDTVSDLESLRKALGAKQITYYGYSYGTYIGQVYATLHPNRVRRMVLDSIIDPRNVFYRANLNQDVGFQKTIRIFFRWLAKYSGVYHVGRSGSAVERGYDRELARLDRHPAGGVIGPDELEDVLLSAGYSRPDLAGHRRRVFEAGDQGRLLGHQGPVRRGQHDGAGRRQRLCDVQRHPVHGRALATKLAKVATRQLADLPQGAVRDVGKRLGQRAVFVLARQARSSGPRHRTASARAGPPDRRDVRRSHTVRGEPRGPIPIPDVVTHRGRQWVDPWKFVDGQRVRRQQGGGLPRERNYPPRVDQDVTPMSSARRCRSQTDCDNHHEVQPNGRPRASSHDVGSPLASPRPSTARATLTRLQHH